jgi:hypothetical protein
VAYASDVLAGVWTLVGDCHSVGCGGGCLRGNGLGSQASSDFVLLAIHEGDGLHGIGPVYVGLCRRSQPHRI